MVIKQYYDKELSHASYALIDGNKMVVIDPSRNPEQYYKLANEYNASIVYVLETHPHADFVSGHLQIHNETGAAILVNSLVDAKYPHQIFDHNQEVLLNSVVIKALHTPGHSPDSNSYLAYDSITNQQVLFTGDFLFIGDVGRPDLRESVGATTEAREKLAKAMYYSINTVLNGISDETVIYPTHGAGSLCGKNLSNELFDTLGSQRNINWALQPQSLEVFVQKIVTDQSFIPKYFSYSVEQNRIGVDTVKNVLQNIPFIKKEDFIKDTLIIDTRQSDIYKKSMVLKSINIPAEQRDKFETWLGSIVGPHETFYLIVSSKDKGYEITERVAKIGYEKNIQGIYIVDTEVQDSNIEYPNNDIVKNQSEYTIIDTRQPIEHRSTPIFVSAINIPLYELREKIDIIPTDKPIVVHCAGGYRSAIASSIIKNIKPDLRVVDLGVRVKTIQQ